MVVENEPEYPSDISPELQDLLEKLLEKDPRKRPTITEILQHPWLDEPPALQY